jgi:hypothetical protein
MMDLREARLARQNELRAQIEVLEWTLTLKSKPWTTFRKKHLAGRAIAAVYQNQIKQRIEELKCELVGLDQPAVRMMLEGATATP